MSDELVQAFFTVRDGTSRIGFVVQGGRVAGWDWAARQVAANTLRIGERWPELADKAPQFTAGFDAAFTPPSRNPWTVVLCGDMCVELQPLTGTATSPFKIDEYLPGLPPAFQSGIDAALPAPGNNRFHLFKGSQCALYDMRSSELIEVKSIEATLTGLGNYAPQFATGITAATSDPGDGRFYLFKGDRYTSGVLAESRVDQAAAEINDTSWPGLVAAFTPGRLLVQYHWKPQEEPNLDLPNLRGVDLASGRETGVVAGVHAFTIPYDSLNFSPDGRYLYYCPPVLKPRVCWNIGTGEHLEDLAGGVALLAGVQFSPDGQLAHYVGLFQGFTTQLVTARTGTFDLVSQIPFSATPNSAEAAEAGADPRSDGSSPGFSFAVGPEGRYVYIAQNYSDTLHVLQVDLQEKRVTRNERIVGPYGVLDLRVHPDGHTLYFLENYRLASFNLQTEEVRRAGHLPEFSGLGLCRPTGELYGLVRGAGGGVRVIEPATFAEVGRIPVAAGGGPGTPRGITFSHGGTRAYVCDSGSPFSVAVISTTARSKDASIAVPMPPGFPAGSIPVGVAHSIR
ncbi:hypothetical protein [Frankia sp. QA3]|uniref:hypothetical protein n=1 Tax=Frankia sp. QA3 TaxID=710111 RepID=UPI000269BFF0|nr:hypothetical protein [Frankia sp. QA3]EIV92472.1 hypothetical protein FraQA3DRAFT_2040 [Frankia sp. QA3]